MTELKVTETQHLNKDGTLSVTKNMQNPRLVECAVKDSEKLRFTVSRSNKYAKCVADLRKRISFDGISFWFEGQKIGRIDSDSVMSGNIPKEQMIAEKEKCIQKLMQCEVC